MVQLSTQQIVTIGVTARLLKRHGGLLTPVERELVAQVVGRWATDGDEAEVTADEWTTLEGAYRVMRAAGNAAAERA